MSRLLRFHGYGLPLGARVYPTIAGRGDTASLDMTTGHPALNFQKVSILENPSQETAAQAPPFGRRRSLYFEDLLGQSNRMRLRFSTPPSPRSTPSSVYSARFYYRITALGDALIATAAPLVCQFFEGPTARWALQLTWWAFDPANQYRPFVSGVAGPTATGLQSLGTFRFEIQVDAARNPAMVVRVYQGEDTSPVWAELRGSPANVTADAIELGDNSGGYVHPFYVSDLEVHDDYNLGGQFTSNPSPPAAAAAGATGARYFAPAYSWSEWDGSTEIPLTDAGTWDGATLDTDDPLAGEVFARRLANVTYTVATYQYRSSPALSLDLYKPAGPGPHPVCLYAHSGFGVTGTRTADLDLGLVEELTNAGYALASLSYNLGTGMVGAPLQPATYPVWPAPGAGQYPSWIIDYKLAARYLIQNAAALGLDPDRLAGLGYSFGGYLAHAANASRELTDDGSGRNLTIRNPTYGIVTADADPVLRGSFTWGAPVNMQTASTYDPTHPSYGPGNQGVGTIRAAAAAFRGLAYNATPNLANTDLANMVTRNAARCAPIAYTRGLSDYLVHWEHEPLLSAACATAGVPYASFVSPTFHDNLLREFNYLELLPWLDAVTA